MRDDYERVWLCRAYMCSEKFSEPRLRDDHEMEHSTDELLHDCPHCMQSYYPIAANRFKEREPNTGA